MRNLPSWDQLVKAASTKNGKGSKQQVILEVLSYGTDYDAYPKDATTLSKRSQEAAIMLTKLFTSTSNASWTSVLESWIVDSLWLVNSLIPPPSLDTNNGDDDDDDDDTASYQALVHIVTTLACSAITMDDNDDDNDDSNNDKQQEQQHGRGYRFVTRLQSTLDPTLLETCHILTKVGGGMGGKDSLVKRLRKLNTDLFYRQQKFNIPHEESEGYAKLLSLLTHLNVDEESENNSVTTTPTKNPNHDSGGSSPSRTTTTTIAAATQKVIISKRLSECMAAFELDPNRVLDLMLDILESQMSTSTPSPTTLLLLEVMKEFSLKKIPHLLGFKLTSYSNNNNNSTTTRTVPEKLYQMIVLLVQHDMLQLETLRPHMSDTMDQITKGYTLWTTYERKRIRSMGRIRLAASSSSTDTTQEQKEQEQVQKIQTIRTTLASSPLLGLLDAFLQQGDWNSATKLVPFEKNHTTAATTTTTTTKTLWSQICVLLPVIGETICTHVNDSIQPLYKALLDPPCLTTTTATPKAATTNVLSTSATLEETIQFLSEPIYSIVDSGCIELHPALYCKLCRLIGALMKQKHHQQQQQQDDDVKMKDTDQKDAITTTKEIEMDIDQDTYTFLQIFLVPSLSVFGPNPALSSELWSVLQLLPYSRRYQLYNDWRGTGLEQEALHPTSTKSLVQAKCEMEAGKAARYSLKRLSKDNVRDMGRQVSKVTHSNPLVVLSTILNQIESYGNLIEMMVEAVRFVTPLSLDVLGFCILSRLRGAASGGGGGNRSRLKGDGVNVSQWLASIEAFTGAFYKKCPDVEFRGILCFLIHRLSQGHVIELGVLRTLLKTAGGYGFADYTSSSSLSKEQLVGRTGSQLLKRETFAFGVVEKLNPKSSRLIRSILQSDGMGVTMLILLAQVRSRILFYQESMTARPKPIKLLGNLFDTCQCVMGLLLEFLTVSMDRENGNDIAMSKYGEFLPSLVALQKDYGLDWEVAWMLCRPAIRAASVEEGKLKEQLTLLESYLSDPDSQNSTTLSKTSCARVAPELFQLFYSNATYDIQCPVDSYEAEINRLKEKVDRLTHLQRGGANAAGAKAVLAATAAAAGATQSEINRATQFSRADEEELLRATNNTANLTSDLSKHKKHYETKCEQIKATKDKVFNTKQKEEEEESTAARSSSLSMADVFLSDCIFPRCSLTPDDAMYCAQFVSLVHKMETPGFSTLSYVDGLINAVAGTLFCVTEGEAANVAVLLCETWQTLSRWRYDEQTYEKEVAGKPGCFMENSGTSTSSEGEMENNSDDDKKGSMVAVTYDAYKSLYSKWHATIGEAALGCLKSSEYIHIRASLIVLTRLVNCFPTQPAIGEKLMDALAPLQEENYPLKDITAMAQSYGFLVTKARNDGVWKEEDAGARKKRQDKEKAAQEERRNAAKKRFEEMKVESEEITAQVGDFVGRGGGRTDRRDGRTSGRSTPAPPSSGVAHKFEPPAGKSMPNTSRIGTTTTTSTDANRDSSRRGGDDTRRGGGREREKDRQQGPGDWRTDSGSAGRRGGRGSSANIPGLEGRWERGAAAAPPGRDSSGAVGGNKRERSPPRDMGSGRDMDRDDQHPSKRQRMDRDGGGRGRQGRSPSPRSRPSSPTHRNFKQPDRGGANQRQHSDRNVGGSTRSTRRPVRR